jgi:NAD(P)-dependent dehydrogenase (short-subunit alcohol dehydrogenase family)
MGKQARVVLVTGTSSGFGLAISRALAADGHRVFGTARASRASMPDGFTTLTLDVTQDASVAACVAEVLTMKTLA